MATDLVALHVFLASPTGLDGERSSFRDVLSEYNDSDAIERGFCFVAQGWETTLSGVGRPQGLINRLLGQSDYFLLVLHDRWGTPSGRAGQTSFSSGTLEEYEKACSALSDRSLPMKEIVLFFKAVNDRQAADPGPQLKKVLAFRKKSEEKKDMLFATYDTVENFKARLRRHLAKWIRDNERGVKEARSPRIVVPGRDSDWEQYDVTAHQEPEGDWQDRVGKAEELADAGDRLEAELMFSRLVVDGCPPEGIARYGRFLRKSGHFQRSISILKSVLEKAAEGLEANAEAGVRTELGKALARSGEPEAALESFAKASLLYGSTGNREKVALLSRQKGFLHLRRGNPRASVAAFEESKEIFEGLGDQLQGAKALGYLGLALKAQGDLDRASEAHATALRIYEQLQYSEGIPYVLSNLGVVRRMQGHNKDALRLHRRALELFGGLNDKAGLHREYSNIGTAYRWLGELEKAREMYEKALVIAEELGHTHGLSIQYANIGRVLLAQKQFDESEEMFGKSLELSIRTADRVGEALQLESIGRLHAARGQLAKAEQMLTQAVDLNRKMHAQFNLAGALSKRGEVRAESDQPILAREDLEEAESLYREMSVTDKADALQVIVEKLENTGS